LHRELSFCVALHPPLSLAGTSTGAPRRPALDRGTGPGAGRRGTPERPLPPALVFAASRAREASAGVAPVLSRAPDRRDRAAPGGAPVPSRSVGGAAARGHERHAAGFRRPNLPPSVCVLVLRPPRRCPQCRFARHACAGHPASRLGCLDTRPPPAALTTAPRRCGRSAAGRRAPHGTHDSGIAGAGLGSGRHLPPAAAIFAVGAGATPADRLPRRGGVALACL